MKTGWQISKRVWAILAVGIALIALVIWSGLRTPRSLPAKLTARAKTAPATPEPTTPPPATAPTNSPARAQTGLPPVVPISLKGVVVAAENGSWLRDKDYLLAPHDPQEFGGVKFLMDGMIQLQGRTSKDWKNYHYRSHVVIPLTLTNEADGARQIIQRGSNVATLFLLGGTRYGDGSPAPCADLIWRYTDGTEQRTPVAYGEHFRDWVRNPYEQPAHLPYPFTKVVWTLPRPSQPGAALRLYRAGFTNPAPAKIIDALELASSMNNPTLFIVGVTLDPLKLGERPDDTPDLEPTDANPPKQIQIFVQSADGAALAQAKLQIQFEQRDGKSRARSHFSVDTDASGYALVNYPPQDLDRLQIAATHDGYGGRKMLWDLTAGDAVPASYTLKLGAGVNIRGVVVDTGDSAISDAAISLYRFWTGSDGNPDRKGEQADFPSQTVTTDAQGRWQAKGLPVELLDHIGFDVKHEGFMSTNLTVGANSAVEAQLRAGTLKIVLHRGLDVNGLVTDDNNLPLTGATVWSGRRFFRDRQKTTTDDQGRFSFHNVSAGDVLFSAMAQGRSPDSKTISVHSGMDEIVFRLKAGTVIRAHVQDESSQPVANARVILEGSPGEPAYDAYEFSANTDRGGDFTWDSAPDQPMPFTFFHDGFEAKRGVKLAPNQDNVVTLRRTRHLQGQVLDATTQQAVTNFSVRAGQASADGANVYGVLTSREFSSADGTFAMDLNEESDNAIAVYADNYADQILKLPDAQDGVVQVTVLMKPDPSVTGVVYAPDGAPAPSVTVGVAAANPRMTVQLVAGRLRSYEAHANITTTDGQGRFKIASPPENGTVVAAGDPGFGRAPLAEVRGSGILVLQAWGRIEGTLQIGGQPGVGKQLLFNFGSGSSLATDFNGYKTTTDGQGHFTFEKVPPGDGAIVRLIQTSPNSWTWSDNTAVTVLAGQTTQVTLGDNGAVLVGQVLFNSVATNGEVLNFEGHLSSPMPPRPAFSSAADAQAYFKSPEYQALLQQRKNYTFVVNADGSFTVDDVAPGTYTLNVTVRPASSQPWLHPPLAQGGTTVTVPDSFSPTSPIYVGEVVLQANPRP